MSGSSDIQDCPRCGGEQCVQVYSDWKPHDMSDGICLKCGYAWDTAERIAPLFEVQETIDALNDGREEDEQIPQITTLAPPVKEWLESSWLEPGVVIYLGLTPEEVVAAAAALNYAINHYDGEASLGAMADIADRLASVIEVGQ